MSERVKECQRESKMVRESQTGATESQRGASECHREFWDESGWIKVDQENGELSGLRYASKRGFRDMRFSVKRCLTTQKNCLYPKILVLSKPPTIAGTMDTRIRDTHLYRLDFKGSQKKITWCIFYDGRCSNYVH